MRKVRNGDVLLWGIGEDRDLCIVENNKVILLTDYWVFKNFPLKDFNKYAFNYKIV